MLRKSLMVFVTMALLTVSFTALPRVATTQDGDTAVTMWFVIFNSPDACTGESHCTLDDLFNNPEAQGSAVYAMGQRVQSNGLASFASSLGTGSTIGALLGPGLTDPMKAEIHLILRTHGQVLHHGKLDEQVYTLNGGCPPNVCEDMQVAIHLADDADEGGRSISDVLRISDDSIVADGQSTLIRQEDGIFAVVNTDLN